MSQIHQSSISSSNLASSNARYDPYNVTYAKVPANTSQVNTFVSGNGTKVVEKIPGGFRQQQIVPGGIRTHEQKVLVNRDNFGNKVVTQTEKTAYKSFSELRGSNMSAPINPVYTQVVTPLKRVGNNLVSEVINVQLPIFMIPQQDHMVNRNYTDVFQLPRNDKIAKLGIKPRQWNGDHLYGASLVGLGLDKKHLRPRVGQLPGYSVYQPATILHK